MVLNQFVAFDQTVNALLLGDLDETISSRAGKAQREGERWTCALCATLNPLEKNYCPKSIEADEGKSGVDFVGKNNAVITHFEMT